MTLARAAYLDLYISFGGNKTMDFLYIVTLTMLIAVTKTAPVVDNSNQMTSLINDILDLKLQLKTERENRMKLQTEFDM